MDSGTMDWTVIGVGIALAGLMLVTTRGIRAEMRATAWRRMPNRTSQRIERLDAGLKNVHYHIVLDTQGHLVYKFKTFVVHGG